MSLLDRLRALGGRSARNVDWTQYSELGITAADTPALIELMIDPALNSSTEPTQHWIPLHAWRALAQLGTVEMVNPLLELHQELGGDDNLFTDLSKVMVRVGPAALPLLALALRREEWDPFIRSSIGEAIAAVGVAYPEVRSDAISVLADQLAPFERQDGAMNGLLVSALLDLRAVECVDTIERVMTSEHIDEMIVGDWKDVQIALGLLDARRTPRSPPFAGYVEQPSGSDAYPTDTPQAAEGRPVASNPKSRKKSARAKATRKSKRKLSKTSRRRNKR